MVIIVQASWPLESSPEVGKVFPTLPASPEYVTKKGPYIYSAREGVQSITLYEFDQSKMHEVMLAINSRFPNC